MLVRHANGRLHLGVLFHEAAEKCTDDCGTGTVCFDHMTERLGEVADLLRKNELQIDEARKVAVGLLDSCFCNGTNGESPDCAQCTALRKVWSVLDGTSPKLREDR